MRRILLPLCFLWTMSPLFAQYLEVGIGTGPTSYIGDLQPNQPNMGSFQPSYSLFARYHYRPEWSFRGSLSKSAFHATDAYAQGLRRRRGLEVLTDIYEVAAMAEWNVTGYDIIDGRITAPYFFAGVAGFYFNPKARYKGVWTDLHPLGTEGQYLAGGQPYSRFQVAIPMGLGIKLALSRRINIGVELGFRQTFTDYLDDVSGVYPDLVALEAQNPTAAALSFRTPERLGVAIDAPIGQARGDRYKTDLYYTGLLTLSYNLADRRRMEFNRSYRSFWNQ